jgi:hypothetical protein
MTKKTILSRIQYYTKRLRTTHDYHERIRIDQHLHYYEQLLKQKGPAA